ncbi:hypothetical protein GCM10023100_63090 [Actinocorallia cavernae]|uniref:Uncharacterized protein n=2 Tax=Actinomycetes TaxID=1760 RepID=A0ABP8T5S5_9ACTN
MKSAVHAGRSGSAFADQRGYRVGFTTRMRGSGMGLAAGRQGPVGYLPAAPRNARVSTGRHTVGPVVFALLGGLALPGRRGAGPPADVTGPGGRA